MTNIELTIPSQFLLIEDLDYDLITYESAFTMTSAGSPEIQNLIPIEFFVWRSIHRFTIISTTLHGYGCKSKSVTQTSCFSSGALDSLPHNGYVVTTIQSICGEKHSEAYRSVGAITAVVPALGTAIAIILFSLGLGI